MNALSELARSLGVSEQELEEPFRQLQHINTRYLFDRIRNLSEPERKAFLWLLEREEEVYKIEVNMGGSTMMNIVKFPFQIIYSLVTGRNPEAKRMQTEAKRRDEMREETKRLKGEKFPGMSCEQWGNIDDTHRHWRDYFVQQVFLGGVDSEKLLGALRNYLVS